MMNRIPPQLPAHAMRTYAVDAPLSSHWRTASCSEVDCDAWRTGWLTVIDERSFADIEEPLEGAVAGPADVLRLQQMTDLRQRQAYYIRRLSGRRFIESKDGQTGHTVFDFAPGQECFEQHRVRLDRPEVYTVRGGDFRGNPTGEQRIHDRPEHWLEDFAEHQDALRRGIDG